MSRYLTALLLRVKGAFIISQQPRQGVEKVIHKYYKALSAF
nr:hypothetical protein [Klebsiella michiganensis]UGK55345.1 Hypothetical protein [Raoultella ornithinolytica]UVN19588.1 hypothetical protein [Klebsiella michiganensis]UWX38081.1 hypothetical protein KJK04_p0385 [Klebsiella quasipneumoniae]